MSIKKTSRKLPVGLTLIAGAAMTVLATGQAQAKGAKIGLLGGITGPIAAPMKHIINGARLAVRQVNAGGGILGGKLVMVQGDTKCSPQSSVAAANKMVNIDRVSGIVGAMCSSATIAAANSVAVPKGIAMISPASTSPAITGLKDKDFIFRTAATDTIQAAALARAVLKQGVKVVAVTYVNNDYGKGVADNFKSSYEKGGGKITVFQAHEDKKPSYRAEIAALAKGGAKYLVLIAYPNSSAPVFIQQSIEGGLFKQFIGPEAFYDQKMWKKVGIKNLNGALYTRPGLPNSTGNKMYTAAMKKAFPKSLGQLFVAHTYDSMMVMALAIQKAGSTNGAKVRDALRAVSNGKGTKVYPGQWRRAVALIKAGKDIDYAGGTGAVDFDANGDPTEAAYKFFKIVGGKPMLLGTYK